MSNTLHLPILFEDQYLMIIDKPSNLVVNRAQSVKDYTVQDWVIQSQKVIVDEKINDLSDFYKRAGIVHRLDKDTSGLLLIAKNVITFLAMQSQFKNRQITKKYEALVHGKVTPESGEINIPVGRLPWNRERFGVLVSGRPALTSYSVLGVLKYLGEFFSLLEVIPHTGRTHQIRIHLKYLGYSIVGDKFYAGRKLYQQDLIFCPRLFLHAKYLRFKHPVTLKEIAVESLLAKDLQDVLYKMNYVDTI